MLFSKEGVVVSCRRTPELAWLGRLSAYREVQAVRVMIQPILTDVMASARRSNVALYTAKS